ncbi:hypothetical protein GPALN_012038 [Globodera pallida]|nr:hypothetical protein GPALN_012038 [Globodera pallida]
MMCRPAVGGGGGRRIRDHTNSGFYDEKLEQYKSMHVLVQKLVSYSYSKSVHYCLNNLEQVVGEARGGTGSAAVSKKFWNCATPKNAEKKTVAGADQQ